MMRSLARRPRPHINIALVVAAIWASLAVAAAFVDIARLVETW